MAGVRVSSLTKSYGALQVLRDIDLEVAEGEFTVEPGDGIQQGGLAAAGWAEENGELALGKNLLVAFMPWQGYNFEDAIVLSEKLVAEDVYTSTRMVPASTFSPARTRGLWLIQVFWLVRLNFCRL